jgi:rhodanese-related sulfurtransferase
VQEEIDPDEARRLVAEGGLLLDVREPDEWEAGHAPGSLHVPLRSLPAEQGRLPTDHPVVAVCAVGQRSARAAQALRAWGYEAANLAGGLKAWAAAGLPVVTDDGGPGQVV